MGSHTGDHVGGGDHDRGTRDRKEKRCTLGFPSESPPEEESPFEHEYAADVSLIQVVEGQTEEGFLSTQTVLIRGLMNMYVSLPLDNIFCFCHSKYTEHSSRFSPHPG